VSRISGALGPLIGDEGRDGHVLASRKHMRKTLIRGADKEKEAQEHFHLTRPPRLEGKAKNAMVNPVRKPKTSSSRLPERSDRKSDQE